VTDTARGTERGGGRALRLRVLSPRATLLDEPVQTVVAPLPDGWLGVLPGHASFQARLLRGQVAFEAGGGRRTIATIGGVISVSAHAATVLTGAAAPDLGLATLEHELGAEATRLREMEREAERHFDRVYRALAGTFGRRRRFDSAGAARRPSSRPNSAVRVRTPGTGHGCRR
jgi:F0F1-type ATP synthase epsilon subunit